MIDLVNRETIFKTHANIAHAIYEFQKAFFNLDKLDYIEADDENSAEFLEHIHLKDYKVSPQKKYYKVISFEHEDLETFPKTLGKKIALLLYSLEVRNLFVLSHLKMNFFGNLENPYEPLQNAYKILKQITGRWDYKEGFKTNLEDLLSLINIAFWIERCDPSAPEYIFFYDIENRLAFYLCKYGNVHTIEYGTEILNLEILAEQDWFKIDGGCFDKFTEDGIIEGRELKL